MTINIRKIIHNILQQTSIFATHKTWFPNEEIDENQTILQMLQQSKYRASSISNPKPSTIFINRSSISFRLQTKEGRRETNDVIKILSTSQVRRSREKIVRRGRSPSGTTASNKFPRKEADGIGKLFLSNVSSKNIAEKRPAAETRRWIVWIRTVSSSTRTSSHVFRFPAPRATKETRGNSFNFERTFRSRKLRRLTDANRNARFGASSRAGAFRTNADELNTASPCNLKSRPLVRNKVEPVLYTFTNQLDVSCVHVSNCARLATFIEIESRCVRGSPREIIIDLNVEKEGQDVYLWKCWFLFVSPFSTVALKMKTELGVLY